MLSNFISFYFILFKFNLIYFFFQKKKFCDEQCSFSDSGIVLSQTGSKTEPGVQCTNLAQLTQPARPGARAHAVSWPPIRPCRRPQLVMSQRKAAVSWACARAMPAPPAPCCAHSSAVSWPCSALYRNTALAGQSSQVTIQSLVLRYASSSATIPSQVTIHQSVLRYTLP